MDTPASRAATAREEAPDHRTLPVRGVASAFPAAAAPRVALVSMPFSSTRRPSLQLGLLAALAAREGWRAASHHLSLDFAAMIGRGPYELLCQHRGMQLAEWVFSHAAFGARAPEGAAQLLDELPPEYLEALAEALREAPGAGADRAEGRDGSRDGSRADGGSGAPTPSPRALSPRALSPRDWLLRLRQQVAPAFTRVAARAVLAGAPDLIGFTSTFQQNVASFALAREVKALAPQIPILFGGANFDDVMGLEFVRSVAAVDLAVIGEGDEAFPALLRALAAGSDPGAVPGVASRDGSGGVRHTPSAQPFAALDSLPVPDFDDYFSRARRLRLLSEAELHQVDLPVEGSRGCWWGAKHHCVFCGLNAGTMRFRAKSPERFLDEIATLSRRHRSFHIEAVDNIIDMRLFERTLGEIADKGYGWNIFFEVKSNLRRPQVQALAAAGVRRIQPGIESLSTEVLRLIRKGVSALQNVNLLRWCLACDIRPSWNMLWGFPGEKPEYYTAQTAMVGALHHLQPPDGQGRLWMERFSPLFFQAEQFGVRDLRPNRSYTQVYPDGIDLRRAAYFFDYAVDTALPDAAFAPLVAALDAWRAAVHGGPRPRLTLRRVPGYLCIEDSRDPQRPGRYDLEGDLAHIYERFFEGPAGIAAVAQGLDLTRDRVEDAVEGFAERGLMLREGDLALALATPAPAEPR